MRARIFDKDIQVQHFIAVVVNRISIYIRGACVTPPIYTT